MNSSGTTIWRTLIPITSVQDIGLEVYSGTSWWFGPAGHVYFSPVDDKDELSEENRQFEISCRNLVDPAAEDGKRFSWGVPATNERVLSHFTVCCSIDFLCVDTDSHLRTTTPGSVKHSLECPRETGKNSPRSRAHAWKLSMVGIRLSYSATLAIPCPVCFN